MSADDLLAELRDRGISEMVLAALAATPRKAFVGAESRADAYANRPLPIGEGQTISQPYVVALMVEALHLRPGDRVLDVGTGSGWHAAILARLGGSVLGIERHASLAAFARANLAAIGRDVEVRCGDGARGAPDRAPFDAINVAASAAERIPPALEAQLTDGGRLVAPVDERLVVVRRRGDVLERHDAGAVRFVPLVEGQG